MGFDLDSLNLNQRQAVEWNNGPLLVLAGPGSGKTRVLTLRIARLLRDTPEQRFRILGLTFTSKAADEMRNRVEQMIPDARERALLTTFHSFCADLLRQHGSHLGARPDFTILNQPEDRKEVIRDSIRELRKKGVEIEADEAKFLPLIDWLLDRFVSEEKVKELSRNPEFGAQLQVVYEEYRRQLRDKNRFDFGSLLFLAHQLLTSKPFIAKHLRTIYPHICVDEYQDTNLAQDRVLRAIVGDAPKKLFVVADDDQIIYQWNGASPERLARLREDFKMSVIQLPVNYRCPRTIIALANNLIQHNSGRSPEKQAATGEKDDGQRVVRVNRFDTVDAEFAWIAEDVLQRPETERRLCVILGRTKKLLEKGVSVMKENGLTAVLTARKSEFETAPLRWLHAILRLAHARGDSEQLRRACRAFYDLEDVDLSVDEIAAISAANGGDYLRTWMEQALSHDELETETRNFLSKAMEQIVNRLDFPEFIESAFAWFELLRGRLPELKRDIFADFQDEKSAWQELQQATLAKYGTGSVSLHVLLQEFDLAPKMAPLPASGVQCLTIHSAKGLEFEHVYLAGLVEEQLPSFESVRKGDDSREMQEERRNCFVAITRAQTSLTLTYADKYFGWPKKPSRFLSEMGSDLKTLHKVA